MFGFQSKRSKEEEKAGIQFLASMLVCYPEISSLSYDPRRSTLTFAFIVRGDYPAARLDAFARLLSESIETYHVVVADEEVGANIWVEEITAGQKTVMFHVERDVVTLERDELTLIARLFTEHFGKALLVDEHSLQKLEEDFATVQSDLLDQMLDQVQRQEFRFRMHMVGLRENDRVVVYNR